MIASAPGLHVLWSKSLLPFVTHSTTDAGNASRMGHFDSMYLIQILPFKPNYYQLQIFSAARNLALRARPFLAVSSSLGTTGRFVSNLRVAFV